MLKSVFYYCICAGPHCCRSFKISGINKNIFVSFVNISSVTFSGTRVMLLSGI